MKTDLSKSKPEPERCPHCGYCPNCGRSNQYVVPHYVPVPWRPAYPTYPIWYTNAGAPPLSYTVNV